MGGGRDIEAPAICIACGARSTETLVELLAIPVVANDLHEDVASARAAACGDMRIEYCSTCHHFFNSRFDDSLIAYSANYETSLHFSRVFEEYAAGLVQKLIREYGIAGKRILEIGCGRGEFLNSLCAGGANQGIGFDTSYDGGDTIGDRAPGLTIHDTYFDADLELEPFDLLVSQQVLEHVTNPREFLSDLVSHPSVATGDALLYLEVPNGLYTFENDGIWDLIYEHVSYFSLDSLERLVKNCGCEIVESGESYGGQYLYVIAQISGQVSHDHEAHLNYDFVDGFSERFDAKLAFWRDELAAADVSAKTYVWGAGSKGITFCNIVDPDRLLGGLIDRHPNKVGKHICATGLAIGAAEDLSDDEVDRVVVMNPLYLDEIRGDLQHAGIHAIVETA